MIKNVINIDLAQHRTLSMFKIVISGMFFIGVFICLILIVIDLNTPKPTIFFNKQDGFTQVMSIEKGLTYAMDEFNNCYLIGNNIQLLGNSFVSINCDKSPFKDLRR